MTYYAKSKQKNGKQPTVREHLREVSDKAGEYGAEIGLCEEAKTAGMLHDFGKYSRAFQDVLNGTASGIDHASAGALYLYRPGDVGPRSFKGPLAFIPVMEAILGHHDGLIGWDQFRDCFYNIKKKRDWQGIKTEKRWSVQNDEEYRDAADRFKTDFPGFSRPRDVASPLPIAGDHADLVRSMLYTRFLFSCLVDADYSVSAHEADMEEENYFETSEYTAFDVPQVLRRLYAYRDDIRRASTAEPSVNAIRDEVFEACGNAGEGEEGLYTLTAPTGTGKTLALLHFALRHCLKTGKRRIILVLPFLTLAEQNTEVYRGIVPDVLVDHSQSDLPDSMRELAARWRTPFIITTSVKFFESLFASAPTDCRKLHNIANSIVVFDEAQSLPADLTKSTLNAVNELCARWHVTMLFSTATQPDYDAIPDLTWKPTEILPNNGSLYRALKRTRVEWRIGQGEYTPFSDVAQEMASETNVCAIVNLRKHAFNLFELLKAEVSDRDALFLLTTDLCPEHRKDVVKKINDRQKANLPCYVVATQCVEAGVDLDFDVMFRALAPLEAIIQAAGRCNRNGRKEDRGRVIVFVPDEEKLYPGNWYGTGAAAVQRMYADPGGVLDFHSPETVRAYYRKLFENQKEKKDLVNAIVSRDFRDTDRQYRLIEERGVRVLVPYAGKTELFEQISEAMKTEGLTKQLMREAAPITVTTFEKEIKSWAEPIPFRSGGINEESDWFVLRAQFRCCYHEDTGLQFEAQTGESSEQIFTPIL